MVSWRSWFAVVLVGLAVAAACSGKSDTPSGGGKGGRGASGGTAGRAGGSAGAGASFGGSSGSIPEGGEGGEPFTSVGGSAGAAGFGASAGTFPIGGVGGVAGQNVAGGSAFAGQGGFGGIAPFNWACPLTYWRDGTCDCGCNTPDPDCKSADIKYCKVCDRPGSCNGGECPGRIDPDNNATCEPAPTGWTCPIRSYGDGTSCDCGCGIPDPDCEGEEGGDACDDCDLFGSCSFQDCPGGIDPQDNSACSYPSGWTCSQFDYGDQICDCGCGAKDVDCESLSGDDCQFCTHGCSSDVCPGTIDPEDNRFCTTPSFNWTCAPRSYNDGSICHCGCGDFDPDCESGEIDSCDRCNVQGSCSGQDCPGTINPASIVSCLHPEPPPEWTCDWFSYGDGSSCDCGCGAFDVDCRTMNVSACNWCGQCGVCPASIDPTDISSCRPPPAEWRCSEEAYYNGECDCGCGVLDPACVEPLKDYCVYCPEGSCSRSDCRDIVLDDNATCDGGIPVGWDCSADYYGDFSCDCGCGVKDTDCADLSISSCEYCNSAGSCSTAPTCPGTIDPQDNANCE